MRLYSIYAPRDSMHRIYSMGAAILFFFSLGSNYDNHFLFHSEKILTHQTDGTADGQDNNNVKQKIGDGL